MKGQLANHLRVIGAAPQVGMGCTVFSYTDRSAGTVSRVSPSGKTAWYRSDIAVRTDDNSMSESQTYEFVQDDKSPEVKVTLRKDGQWREQGRSGRKVVFGHRDNYHDFSF